MHYTFQRPCTLSVVGMIDNQTKDHCIWYINLQMKHKSIPYEMFIE